MPIDVAAHLALIRDIDTIPSNHQKRGEPAYHTDQLLSALPGAHWVTYRAAVRCAADAVAAELGLLGVEPVIYTSAISYRAVSEYTRKVGHSHVAATLVVAMPLRLPRGLDGSILGGTVLRNPLPSLNDLCGSPVTWTTPAHELEALIFPGFIEHRPALPHPETDLGRGRLLLTADVCYF